MADGLLEQLARGVIPAELAARPTELVEHVARWWKAEAARGALEASHVEVLSAIVAVPIAELSALALVAELIATVPAALVYRLWKILDRAHHLGPAFADALYARLFATQLPARAIAIGWLLSAGRLSL